MTPTTLTDLQDHVATACQIGSPALAASAGNYTAANRQTAERRFTDFVTKRFAGEMKGRDEVSETDRLRINEKLERKARKFAEREKVPRLSEEYPTGSEKCGFVAISFLIGGLISWLLGKALDWLWAWWREKRASAEVQAICGEAGGDDGDDD